MSVKESKFDFGFESKIKSFELESEIIVKELMNKQHMSKEQAIKCWYNSKTKKRLEDNDMYWVPAMRCYWELLLEINGNDRWFSEPFDL